MTGGPPPELPPPLIDTQQTMTTSPAASLDAVTTLVHSFALMVQGVEHRLTERLTDNAQQSRERWTRWESDFREYREATDRRIGILEASVHDHHAEAERARIVADARTRPIRFGAAWLWDNRRDILILILGLLTLLGVADLLSAAGRLP